MIADATDPEVAERIRHMSRLCPSRRLATQPDGAEERDEPEFAASIGVIRDAFHRGARSAPLFPRLDPAEHFLGVALGREHWVEDLLHDAVSHEQGETLQQHVPAGMEGRQSKRFGEPQICVLSKGNGSRSRSTASSW